MKSRRRIAFPKALDHANRIDDYSRDLRLTKWGSGVSLHGSKPEPLMSALPPKADIVQHGCNVRCVPIADLVRAICDREIR